MQRAVLAGLAALALSSAARAQDVSYDFDRGADFTRFKTYAWTRGTPVGDELNHKRIVASVDGKLAAKGMTRVELGANPDLLVTYHAKFDKSLKVTGFTSGMGYRWGASRSGSARADEVTVGTLIVDLIEPKAGSIVWRGIANKDVDLTENPEKRDKNINKATEKLFKNYPPKQ